MDFTSNFAALAPQAATRLGQEMDRNGFAVLPDFLSAAQLRQAQDQVLGEVDRRPSEFFALHGIESMDGTVLGGLGASSAFRQLLADLYRTAAGKPADDEERIFPVIRCLQGQSGRRESHFYHFDGSVVTALVPLFIPEGDSDCGHLISFANIRPVRRSVLANVVEKAVLHNRLSQKLTAFAVQRQLLKPMTIKLVPGNVYLFWGYCSLHANDWCAPHRLRATALYHFGDPHRDSALGRLLLGSDKRRAKLDYNGLRRAAPR